MPRVNVGGLDSVQTRPPALPEMKKVHVSVQKATLGDFKDGAIKFVEWALALMEGEFQGRTVIHKTNFDVDPAELATWKKSDFDYRGPLKQFLEACGGGWDPDGFDTEVYVGRELRVDITQRTYEGDVFNDVKRPRALGGVAEAPIAGGADATSGPGEGMPQ